MSRFSSMLIVSFLAIVGILIVFQFHIKKREAEVLAFHNDFMARAERLVQRQKEISERIEELK